MSQRDAIRQIDSDADGNVYITSYISSSGNMTILNADNTTFATITGGTTGVASFLVKYNSSGFAQWVRKLSTTNVSGEATIGSIAVDPTGNVYVVGRYNIADLQIYGADHVTTVGTLAYTNRSAFIVKYTSSGNYVWSTRITNADILETPVVAKSAVDSSGNLHVVIRSFFASPYTIYNSDGTEFQTISTSNHLSILVKYDSAGTVSFYIRLYGVGQGVKFDTSGNFYVMTLRDGAHTVFNANGTTSVFTTASISPPGWNESGCLIKYNAAGIYQWALVVGGPPYGCDIDNNGNVYLGGGFASTSFITKDSRNTVEFEGGYNSGYSTQNRGYEGYLIKFNASGIHQWNRFLEGTRDAFGVGGWELVKDVVVAGNSVYTVGPLASLSVTARSTI
jgi:hypothetical protein